MEPRSLTPSLLLTLFFPLLFSAAVSSSSSAPPFSPTLLLPDSGASRPSPYSFAPPRFPPRAPSPPWHRPPPPLITPSLPSGHGPTSHRSHQSPSWDTPPPRPRRSCPSGHRDCPQAVQSVATKSSSKLELNFGEKLGLLFIGVAAALQVLLGTFLVYKRIQLKKVQHREQRGMASSSGPSA